MTFSLPQGSLPPDCVASGPPALLAIGPKSKHYWIHRPLLTLYSEYFRSALQSEPHQQHFRFQDIQPCILGAFAHWLYTQKLPAIVSFGGDNTEYMSRERWLISLYVLANRFRALEFKKLVLGRLVDYFNTSEIPCYRTIIFAFESLHSSSPILKLLVDAYCRHNCSGQWRLESVSFEKLPMAFLKRCIELYADMQQEKYNVLLDLNAYLEEKWEVEVPAADVGAAGRKKRKMAE